MKNLEILPMRYSPAYMLQISDVSSSNQAQSAECGESPDQAVLRRFATMVGHLFDVPIAYVALLAGEAEVLTRVGLGTEYCKHFRACSISDALRKPLVTRDATQDLPVGINFGDVRFAATAPLCACDGLEFGVLVIADMKPRPSFAGEDLRALGDIARLIATEMETRAMAPPMLQPELARRETNPRFLKLLNSAPVMVLHTGTDGFCSFVNGTWLNFTGRSLEDECGDGWLEVIHPDYRAACRDVYVKSWKERKPFSLECQIRRHDGEYRWMYARCIPRFEDERSFTGCVSAWMDVTEYRATLLVPAAAEPIAMA
jgi:PAS domain S-box-containing protein